MNLKKLWVNYIWHDWKRKSAYAECDTSEREMATEMVTSTFFLSLHQSLNVDLCALCGKSDVIFLFTNGFSSVSPAS